MNAKRKKESVSPNTVTHSPGPYFYERDKNGCDDIWRIVSQPTQATVATISFWHCYEKPEENAMYEADAQLLAASADMFDALKEVIQAFDRLDITATDSPLFRAIRYARHAVALADGTLSYRAC
jgi:hypothetical protein